MSKRAKKTPMTDVQARHERMRWWREARFGLFVHYNMFSLWMDPDYPVMKEWPEAHTPLDHDRVLVEKMQPGKAAVETWVRTARAAGMKYVVLTAKHLYGFCLWDSKVTAFNSVRYGPRRDLVAEFVKACRRAGLKVGIYYALLDRHSGFVESAKQTDADRQRLLRYTRGLLREVMTRYGTIDILWYDGPHPMGYGGEWDSEKINAMVRKLQPGILINDRSLTFQDFTCAEGYIWPTPYADQDWEACATFNGTWAWSPKAAKAYLTPRDILEMLWKCTHGGGNLLLNVGPDPYTGRIHELELERLAVVGKWVAHNGEAIYGPNDRPETLDELKNNAGGKWTKHGYDAYLWLPKWPARDIVIKGLRARVKECTILATGKPLKYTTDKGVMTIRGLPKRCPDKVCGYAVLRLRFASFPR